MNEFLLNNWFSIATLCGVAGGGVFQYATAKQRQSQNQTQTSGALIELKQFVREEVNKLDEGRKNNLAMIQGQAAILQSHMNNADIHVSPLLLDLLKERHDGIMRELSETRLDIGRLEQAAKS